MRSMKIIFFCVIVLFFSGCAVDRLALGYRFLQRTKYERAEIILKSYIQNDEYPDKYHRAIALFYLGFSEMMQDKLDLAIGSYSSAIKSESNFVFAYFNRGLCYMLLGHYEKALHDFKVTDKMLTDPQIEKFPKENFSSSDKNQKYIKINLYYQLMLNLLLQHYSVASILLQRLVKQFEQDHHLIMFCATIYLCKSPIQNVTEGYILYNKALENQKEAIKRQDMQTWQDTSLENYLAHCLVQQQKKKLSWL